VSPNVLFITLDQWRADSVGCMGHATVKTPNIDRLAAEGVLFRNHYAQATPCAPSRASIHTGTYLHNHRCVLNGTPLDQRFTNWALEFQRAGHTPSLFGYTDSARDHRTLDPGDERLTHYSEPLPGIGSYTAYRKDVSTDWVAYLREKGYTIPRIPWDLYGTVKPGIEWEQGGEGPLPLAISSEHHETRFMVEQCMQWIAARSAPWVTHLSLLRPHPPFVAPEPYNRLYPPVDSPVTRRDGRQIEATQHPFLEFMLAEEKFRAPDDERTIQRFRSSYYGLISEVDEHLGRLFDFLRETGQWQNTFVILCSDHGEQMGEHWLMGKLGYFDASYHIPLIIREPDPSADTARGTCIDAFTENVDLMPTLLERMGLAIPAQCDGSSLMPMVSDGNVPTGWRQEVHWEYDFRDVLDPGRESWFGLTAHQCALNVIRDHAFKYVHFTALPPLLFDLKADPGEFNNLAQDPEYREVRLDYSARLLSWRMNHTDRGLTETFLSPEGPVERRAPLR